MSSFSTPPHTPTKVGRLSATSMEAGAHILTPTYRSGARLSTTGNFGTRSSEPRMSGTRISVGALDDSPASVNRTPERMSAVKLQDPLEDMGGPLGDRFIPERTPYASDIGRFLLDNGQENESSRSAHVMLHSPQTADGRPAVPTYAEPYAAALTRALFPGGELDSRSVLAFHRPQPREMSESERYENCKAVIYEENRKRSFMSKSFRVIPQTPERILDAPDLVDDFYLNLLDWSSRNVVAVALANALYLWSADTGTIHQLMTSGERAGNNITGVAWNQAGDRLAVGQQDASAAVWDAETHSQLMRFADHTGRVGALGWNGHVLATASRDSTVRLYDTRAKNCIGLYTNHTQEICGLKWSPCGTQLATGGNDNLLNIWDFNRQTRDCTPTLVINQHNAAVKAIAWNPTQHGILASGGGTADKTLKLWNVRAGELINSVDTKSQVCGAVWNKDGTELVTSHGYVDNQLTVWKYPSLTKVCDLTGHSSRVLHLAMSPDGETVVSAAGDETIRFWRCFARPHDKQKARARPRPLDDFVDFGCDPLR
jgi:cell division cycle protein 20 (cofactor of APC complex)